MAHRPCGVEHVMCAGTFNPCRIFAAAFRDAAIRPRLRPERRWATRGLRWVSTLEARNSPARRVSRVYSRHRSSVYKSTIFVHSARVRAVYIRSASRQSSIRAAERRGDARADGCASGVTRRRSGQLCRSHACRRDTCYASGLRSRGIGDGRIARGGRPRARGSRSGT